MSTVPSPVVGRIELLLRERLQPTHLRVRDDSQAHIGHHSAGGKGHFRVVVVSTQFENLRPLQRQRLVNEVLAPLFETDIHALSMETLTPREFEK